MNINFVCAARNQAAADRMPRLFQAVVEDARTIFGEAEDHQWTDGRVAIFNADRMSGAWRPSTWYEDGAEIIAVSQPPIPVDHDTSAESYWQDVAPTVRRGEMGRLLPNHFGIHRSSDGSVRVWADTLGLGRCYYVITDDFVAASNHIGILTHFLDEPAETNKEAVGRYVLAGWFMLDDSPIRGIRRLRESACLDIGADGSVGFTEHTDLTEIVGQRSDAPDFDGVVDQTRVIARNLDALSVKTPALYLSGGRDSRMTASIWLSGGGNALVKTLGTLEAEAEIAQELMAAFESGEGQEVAHDIMIPTPGQITMSLEERFANAFAMWDGDAAPTNIKSNTRIPGSSAGLSIGGVGGEIMHGYYYLRPGDFEKVEQLENPVAHAARAFRGNLATDFAHGSMTGIFDFYYERAVRHGRPDIASLDYLYLTEKFRRWGNQALGSMAAIMLSGPAYIRACFDLTPQQRVDKIFPDEIVKRALPVWSQIRYYKAGVSDSKRSMKRKLATYDTDPEYFHEVFRSPRLWPEFLQQDKVEGFLDIIGTDEALPVHESWLNRALWIDRIDSHVADLNRRAREVRA
ncbi:hypothetical protein DEO23_05645 [Brachybacterium endophyticum]|uniref:Asparagine synthetase domain-containing protein n=1 Tax=Brachybacterium endophyticum TaxID=2182385 RepID=A0A2U2RKQ5_9MICO|nr:hypothetical protein [Brachybacterium endophyticum]PWH06453.1 hypothetical protein DEO23_05645 [Brachybacterium endophyticum]